MTAMLGRENYSQGSRCWSYYLHLRVSCWCSGRGHAYEVLRKVGKVNYEVPMAGRRKRKQIFHFNMLTDNAHLTQEVTKEEDQ